MKFSDIEGKTIESAQQIRHPQTDDDGWLMLKFTDGTSCMIEGYCGGYTGKSLDEYPTRLSIHDDKYLLPEANWL